MHVCVHAHMCTCVCLAMTVHVYILLYVHKVGKCPEDYKIWLTTMYSHFGGKWCCLYNGPFWSVAVVEQGAAKHLGKTTWAIQDVRLVS